MYVPFETYENSVYAVDITEEEYTRISELADIVLDSWTYHRAQQAYVRGETFPREVTALYCAIVAGVPDLVESAKNGENDSLVLKSFSNGVDDYTFEASDYVANTLKASLQYLIDALPIGWECACVYPVGRCHRRHYAH